MTKYFKPSIAPVNVQARISKINKITYGKIARKYEAFPELLIPLISRPVTAVQQTSRHKTNFQSGNPIPSSMFGRRFIIVFLKMSSIYFLVTFRITHQSYVKYKSADGTTLPLPSPLWICPIKLESTQLVHSRWHSLHGRGLRNESTKYRTASASIAA